MREIDLIKELIMLGIATISEREDIDDYLRLLGYQSLLAHYRRRLNELEKDRKAYLRDHVKGYRYRSVKPDKFKRLKREQLLIRDKGIRDTLTAIRSLQSYYIRRIEKLVREKIIPLLKKLGIYEDIEKTFEEYEEWDELEAYVEELTKKLSITH